ncbi:glycosyltransferase [candidate division KSB1 bacterium]|nr:glycosyltransferase [candidate division KSB1 bacterium]
MIDLSVILVNYNVKTYLSQALESIEKALDQIPSEIIVVDNASTDGSVSMLRKRFPSVQLIANEINVGFATANNQAIQIAKGRVLCLINPDTLVREDTFQSALDYLKSYSDVGMVGGKVLNSDGTLQLACRRSYPTPWVAFTKVSGLSTLFPKSRFFGRYNLTYLNPNEEAEVEAISGSFMIVRKTAVDQAGLLDEQFFMYGEDLDWCFRIHQAGWKIVYLPQTQIVHYKGRSTREASFDSLKLFYSAMGIFVKKHFGRGASILPSWFLMMGIWIRGAIGLITTWLKRLTVPVIDILFMQFALVFALLLRFGNLNHWMDYDIVNIGYTLVWLVSLSAMGLYKKGIFSTSKATGAVCIGLILNASFTFFFPQYAFSRKVVLAAGGFNLLFLGGWRLGIRFASRLRWIPFFGTVGRTLFRRRAVILGSDSAAREVMQRLESRLDTGLEVVGLIALDESEMDGENSHVLGSISDLHRLARRHQIQEVIFTPEAASYERILAVIASGKELHLDYRMVPRDLDVLIGKTSIDSIEDIPLVDLDYKIFSDFNRMIKRMGDLILSLLLTILYLPVTLGVLILPSFSLRKRIVRNGQGEALELWHIHHSEEPSGAFVQIPFQLLSVIQGKMSLIGTEILPFKDGEPGSGFKPGITSLVGIHTRRQLSNEEKARYNLYYLKNYTFLLDLEIMLRTFFR